VGDFIYNHYYDNYIYVVNQKYMENKTKTKIHFSLERAVKELQTTNNDSTPITSNIQDVIILKPPIHVDHRGRLFEICSGTNGEDKFWEKPIVYCYMFSIRPNQLKGWGLHEFKDDRYTLISGEALVVLYDVRPDSKTFEKIQKVYLGGQGNQSLKIPTNVWHCIINIGESEAMLINHPTTVYDHNAPDKLLLPWNTPEIPIDLSKLFPTQFT
jgi:dTDP-4-dehydrorhamnose 3,5-epimerase